MTSTPLLAERFTIAPEVNDLNRDLKRRERSPQQKYALIAIPALFVGAVVSVAGMYFSMPNHSPQLMIPMIFLGAMVVIVTGVLGAGIISMTNTPEKEKVNDERKETQQSIKRSVSTARALGDLVPTLTKEHVDAGARFDKAVTEYGVRWTREDFLGIRALLFEDLSRENALIDFVTVRGMVTLPEIQKALSYLDAHQKPLQSGWL